jgi:co-chaperonin GroES (HSP10)
MKTIGKNIAVRKINEEVKTKSGILLSAEDSSEFRYQKGEVIIPGTEVQGLVAGDVVYYDSRQSYTMVVENENVTLIQERDVVVVL